MGHPYGDGFFGRNSDAVGVGGLYILALPSFRATFGRSFVFGRHLDNKLVVGRHLDTRRLLSVQFLPENVRGVRISPDNLRHVRISLEISLERPNPAQQCMACPKAARKESVHPARALAKLGPCLSRAIMRQRCCRLSTRRWALPAEAEAADTASGACIDRCQRRARRLHRGMGGWPCGRRARRKR